MQKTKNTKTAVPQSDPAVTSMKDQLISRGRRYKRFLGAMFENKYRKNFLLFRSVKLEQRYLKVCVQLPSKQCDLKNQIINLFLATPENLPDMHTVAAALGVSISTLHRRLKKAGQNYQSIKNEFRMVLTHHYLQSGEKFYKRIAYEIGYKDPSSFHRAFKSWSRQTVGEYALSISKPQEMF